MARGLLIETFGIGEQPVELRDKLIESEERSDGIYLNGIIQIAETLNGNRRIYPRPLLEREMRIYDKFIRENRSVGELDHPARNVAWLKEASHMLTEYWWDGNVVMGRMKVLHHTPNGKTLEGLLQDGVRVGVSSRSSGSLIRTSRGDVVDEDLMIICFDVVANPSTPNAFPIRESIDARINSWTHEDKINRLLNEILYIRGIGRK